MRTETIYPIHSLKRLSILALILLSVIGKTTAQSVDLTEEEKTVLKSRIVDKLSDFQYFLKTMADKRYSTAVRQNALESTTSLFIGNCEPYEIRNSWDGTPITERAVQMQVSSRYKSRPTTKPMKLYLTQIFRGMGYSNIRIEQADAIRVDNFTKTPDGKYLAVAHIVQNFIGYGEGGQIRYSDRTQKKVIVHIDVIEIPTADGIDLLYDVKLGDMSVVSTEKLQR